MNDDRPTRDETLTAVLSTTTLAQSHLGAGLRSMLQANGVQPKILDAVQAFVQPVLDRMHGMQAKVIAFTRELSPREQVLASPPEGLVVDAFSAVMKSYSEQFTQLASTPDQMRMAANFNGFVTELTSAMKGREAEKGKEPTNDRDFERE